MPAPPDAPAPESPGEPPPSGPAAVSLASLCGFFRHIPPDTGVAFMVVAPFAPAGHIRHILEALRRCAAIPVIPVTEPVPAASDTIYILPPASHFAIVGGRMELVDLEAPPGRGGPASASRPSAGETPDVYSAGVFLSLRVTGSP